MGLLNESTRDRAAQIASDLSRESRRVLREMGSLLVLYRRTVWNNGKVPAGEAFAAMGTGGAELLGLMRDLQAVVSKHEPANEFEEPLPVEIEDDGTVTVGEAKAEAPAEK